MSTSGGGFGKATPTGPASGDLGGTYPAPTVAGLQGVPISPTPATAGQLYLLTGGVWTPTTPSGITPATTVTGPDAFGAAAAVGSSLLYARQDHDHGLPANPAPAFAVPAIVLGTAAGAGVAATVIRSDATVVAFDVTNPVTQAFGDAAATGAAAVSARRDHKHGMPANPVTAANIDATFTAAMNLYVGTGAGTGTQLAGGTALQSLGVNAGATALVWANNSTSTLTTTGDILYASGAHTLARLGIGATNNVLTVVGGVPTWQAPSSAGVTTFNGAAGAIAQANGYGITGANANPPTPAVSLTSAAGSIGSNVTLTGSATVKVFDTASLGIGTWLVEMHFELQAGTIGTKFEANMAVDTATATFAGCTSAEMEIATGTSFPNNMHGSICAIVTVTVAGTVKLQVTNASATAGNALASTTGAGAYANATGYTAVRIA